MHVGFYCHTIGAMVCAKGLSRSQCMLVVLDDALQRVQSPLPSAEVGEAGRADPPPPTASSNQ